MFFRTKIADNVINSDCVTQLIDQYAGRDNWHNLDQRTANLGYGYIHYAFIRNLKPKLVLCIGSKQGFIPAICALACKDNRQGMVEFVDANLSMKDNDPNNWGGVGFWSTIRPDEYFSPMQQYIRLHLMTTESYFSKLPPKPTFDYCHIDGDHSYAGVSFDFNHCWPRLKSGGICCLHDIHSDDGKNPYGVNKLWRELKQSHRYSMMELPGPFGLGMIQK